jgi:RHS repeat-associated protein
VKQRTCLILGATLLGVAAILGFYFARGIAREADAALGAGDARTTSYRFDALGNLRGVTRADGMKIEYLIDAANRRVGRKVNGKLVQGFLYQDQLRAVAELDGDNNIVSRFIYGSQVNVPEAMEKGGKTYRILTDELGSPRLVIDVASGKTVQRMDYDEFGNVLQDTNPGFQPFGFSGGLYDPDTQLASLGARDYDSFMGRWLTKDPLRFAGHQTNLYEYVGNDPVNRRDPTGTRAVIVRKIPGGTEVTFINPVRIPNWETMGEPDTSIVTPSPEPSTAMAPRGGSEGGGSVRPPIKPPDPCKYHHHPGPGWPGARGPQEPRMEPTR